MTEKVLPPVPPPTNNTLSLASNVAVWFPRPELRTAPETVQVSLVGSYSSMESSAMPFSSKPPATSTRPSVNNVAVWKDRAWFIGAAADTVLVLGS